MAGEVLVDGQKAAKPGQAVASDAVLAVLARPPYVSRGGFKLAEALRHWNIDVAGKVCLDIGSSTGGFTDVLLQAGAARVHAVDVGAGHLDWKLRTEARVVVHEGVNARRLTAEEIGEARRSGHLRRELHLGHADSAGSRAAATAGRANGYTGQTAV
jgi:23S rRNA (cytidine1920-2'-O)/16S rRNA (cytidine1409-2'-O)-methyltransferase